MIAGIRRGAVFSCVVAVGACGGSSEPEADTATTPASTSVVAEPAGTTEPPPTLSPQTSAPPTTPAPETTSPDSAPAAVGPAIDPQLAARIPAVDGYSTRAELPAPWLWSFYNIPDGLTVYPAAIVAADGTEVGRVIVTAGSGGEPPIDAYVDDAFAEHMQFVADATVNEVTSETILATNSAVPAWTEVEGSAVISASVPEQDAWQWAWGADGLLWIVRGTAAAEGFVRAVLQAQVPAIDPYDHQGMTGDLFDHTPVVDGYMYWDIRRFETLAALPDLIIPNCYERVYLGYVRPAGGPPTVMVADDLALAIYDLADLCVDDGYIDQVTSGVEAQGWAPGEVGGVAVMRDATNIVLLRNDILIHMTSGDPQTFDELAPFIEQFLANQPA